MVAWSVDWTTDFDRTLYTEHTEMKTAYTGIFTANLFQNSCIIITVAGAMEKVSGSVAKRSGKRRGKEKAAVKPEVKQEAAEPEPDVKQEAAEPAKSAATPKKGAPPAPQPL